MPLDQEEQQLQALFCEMREDDRRRTAPFRVDVRRADRSRRVGAWRTYAVASGAIVLLTVLLAHRALSNKPARGPIAQDRLSVPTVPSISEWTSPTGFLLEFAADEYPAKDSAQPPVEKSKINF